MKARNKKTASLIITSAFALLISAKEVTIPLVTINPKQPSSELYEELVRTNNIRPEERIEPSSEDWKKQREKQLEKKHFEQGIEPEMGKVSGHARISQQSAAEAPGAIQTKEIPSSPENSVPPLTIEEKEAMQPLTPKEKKAIETGTGETSTVQ